MIQFVRTSLDFSTTFTNTVNLVGVMGAGLAKAVATTYPACLSPYQADLRSGRLRHGTVTAWPKPDGHYILQVPTKIHWRDPSPLALVQASIRALFPLCESLAIDDIHLVKLGCGLGGLNWLHQVKPYLIETACQYPAITVVVHE